MVMRGDVSDALSMDWLTVLVWTCGNERCSVGEVVHEEACLSVSME